MSAGDAQSTVTFTVKEMFLNIQNQLQDISKKLDAKADRADVVALSARVGVLEQDRHASAKWTESRRWLLSSTIALLGVAAAVISAVVR